MRSSKLIFLALWMCAGAALGQSYPSRPVTIVVPFGPGGGTDPEARFYAQKLSERLGQPFVIDYKAGAGGTIGANHVAKAAPDGHTLLIITGTFAAAPALYPKLPYDALTDFTPVSLMSRRSLVLVAHPDRPYKTFKEYIAYARANPGKLNLATTGNGGSPHLMAAQLHQMIDAKVTYVHYKGLAAAVTDLVGGQVDVTWCDPLSALPHVKAGKMRVLAVGTAERNPLFPDVPPIAELVPGFEYTSNAGFLAPAVVPPAIIAKLAAELQAVAKSPDVVNRLNAEGGAMVGSTPAQYREVLTRDVARFKKIVQDTQIRLEQ